MDTLLAVKRDNSLEERASKTNEIGRELLTSLKSIVFLEVLYFYHIPGESYIIGYVCDTKFRADYEHLKQSLLLIPNGLRVEVKNVDEEQPIPSEDDPKKMEINRQSKLIIAPFDDVTNPYKREEVIEKALRKMQGIAAEYLQKRPNARKPS